MAVRIPTATWFERSPMGLASPTSFSLCLWFKVFLFSYTYSAVVTEDNSCGIQVFSGDLNFGDPVQDVTGSTISLDTWYHVAWVRSGSSHTIYLNGQIDVTATSSYSDTAFVLGAYGYSTGGAFNGWLAHLKCWDGVQLTQAEIQHEMRSARPIRAANLFLWSHFMASTTADNSGNGRSWTLGDGTPTIEDGPPVLWGGVKHVIGQPSVALFVAWGEETTDADEQALSWSLWQTAPATPVVVSGDANYGEMAAVTGESCYSSVVDTGDSSSKTFTVTKDKYGAGSGNVTISIRGSASSFSQHDGSPSWATYSSPVSQAWRYVQLKVEYAA